MTISKLKLLLLAVSLFSMPSLVKAQGVDSAMLAKPSTDSWPTYSGDYSSRRYSSLTQINQSNVKNLSLAWVGHVTGGAGVGFGAAAGGTPTIIGGEVAEPVPVVPIGGAAGALRLSGAILEVNGILYITAPDNAWAMDARDGTVIWHYFWKTKGGTHIGNRGMGMYGDWLFFETPDDYLVSLNAKTGKERWHKVISDFDEQYFSTMAPVVIGNHLIVGTGDDLDAPGFLQSFDPETGEVQWKWYTEPEKMGDPGSETWPNLDSMRHGGGGVWVPGSYDPDLHLYYFGTANPTPAFSGVAREGDDLYTSCLVALNVDTGKLAWYFQPSPHDTHDWDSGQTPVIVDGEFNGKPRKLLLDASRNGYFFVLDRVTGEHLLTAPITTTVNWTKGFDKRGQPTRNPEKDATPGGSLVSPTLDGALNWPPPSFDPETGLFYVPTNEAYSEFYLSEPDLRAIQGLSGSQEHQVGAIGNYLTAIDYKTGKIAWRHLNPTAGTPVTSGGGGIASGGTGLLTTAGKLLFGSDVNGNFVAYDPANGKPLWHVHLGQVSNAAETYTLDGKQYILVSSGDAIYAFDLN
jgi:alcohol dehydrogenase (cytochrome c)